MYQGKFLKTPDAPKAHTPKKKSRKSRAGTIVFYSVLGSIILLFCIGMALAMNSSAMAAYAAMTEEQKQAVLNKAHNARSGQEMQRIVNCILQ